jgi:hypothetical protein
VWNRGSRTRVQDWDEVVHGRVNAGLRTRRVVFESVIAYANVGRRMERVAGHVTESTQVFPDGHHSLP